MIGGADPNQRGYGTGAATGVEYADDAPRRTSAPPPSRGPATTFANRGGRGDVTLVATGFEELERELDLICAEDGPKSINAAMRKFAREAVTTIVKPKVLELVPFNDRFHFNKQGEIRETHLEELIVVRALPRSRVRIGYFCGFVDPLFQGASFYGGFLEFGWDHYKGVRVEPDSFLRQALYPNEPLIRSFVAERMRAWIDERNRTTSDALQA